MTNSTAHTMAPCGDCNGTGGIDRPCGACHGEGERLSPMVLCVACGEYEATRDELCARCDDDVTEFLCGGREEPWAMVGAEYDTGARYYVGDDEGELLARGVRC